MPRGLQIFKQTDLLRAIKTFQKAGLPVARAEIDRDGKIIVVTGSPSEQIQTEQRGVRYSRRKRQCRIPCPATLNREVTRHEKAVWYVRVGKGPRIRLTAEFGTAEFEIEYQAAISGKTQPRKSGPLAGSLAWLIDRYRETSAWTSLSMATRRQRENILKQIIGSAGSQRYTAITAATIAAGRDRRSQTPFQARHFLFTMVGLFEWATDAKFLKKNPAAAVKYPLLKSGDGFPVWTEDDVAAYETRWPIGTRQRVWIAVLLYTGLRRGDAVRLGRQHVRDGVASIKTEKTGTKCHDPAAPRR